MYHLVVTSSIQYLCLFLQSVNLSFVLFALFYCSYIVNKVKSQLIVSIEEVHMYVYITTVGL